MAVYYRIASGHSVEVLDDGGIYVLGEGRRFFTDAPLLVRLLPLIDGKRDLEALVRALAPDLGPAEVHFGLGRLEREGLIEAGREPLQPENALPERICVESVRIDVLDRRGGRVLADALAAAQAVAGRDTSPGREVLRILVLPDYVGEGAEAAMAKAEADAVAFLPVKLSGARALVGPLFDDANRLCPKCLCARIRANRPLEAWLARAPNRVGRQAGAPPPVGAAGRLAASALAERLSARRPEPLAFFLSLRNTVLEWNGGDRRGLPHAVVPRICCSRCRPTTAVRTAKSEPPRFDPVRAATRQDGGFRVQDPQTTVATLRPLVSDLTGRISSLGPLDLPATGRHVWAAAYPVMPRTARPGPADFHGIALGKGRSAIQAEASALCEAVERLSTHYRGDAVECVASLAELGESAVPPAAIANFSAMQYRDRQRWNAETRDTRRHIPTPLDPRQPIAWVRAWSLTKSSWRWLPRDHCFANAPPPVHGRFDPNGCAAGSCIEEAVLQGFLELVERDCVAIWWANRILRPGLDASALTDPALRSLAEGFAAQGWAVWLLDVTHDLSIPCVVALARAETDGRWCIGFGCHFAADIAVERAMTELAQLFRADGRDGPMPWQPPPDGDERYLFAHGDGLPADAPTGGIETLAGLIEWSIDRLAAQGIEMIVLDQTDPDIGLPVVKVTAPGLRHFWPRFGPGRLYDVPVRLGWRDRPLAESALNPTHLFL